MSKLWMSVTKGEAYDELTKLIDWCEDRQLKEKLQDCVPVLKCEPDSEDSLGALS